MSVLAALFGLLILGRLAVSQDRSNLPVRYGATSLQGDGDIYPPDNLRNASRGEIGGDVHTLLQDVLPIIQGQPGKSVSTSVDQEYLAFISRRKYA